MVWYIVSIQRSKTMNVMVLQCVPAITFQVNVMVLQSLPASTFKIHSSKNCSNVHMVICSHVSTQKKCNAKDKESLFYLLLDRLLLKCTTCLLTQSNRMELSANYPQQFFFPKIYLNLRTQNN